MQSVSYQNRDGRRAGRADAGCNMFDKAISADQRGSCAYTSGQEPFAESRVWTHPVCVFQSWQEYKQSEEYPAVYVEIFDKIAISNYCSFCLAGTCSGEYCVGKEPVSEIDKKYQKLLETLSPEQEEVITEYCNAIFSSGAETEEFFYRLGLKDGLNLKNAVKFVLEMISWNRSLWW